MDAFLLMWIVLIGMFGLLFGSFLNVVIYRLPRRESIAYPASHCPECGKPVQWYDNIPVLSYVILQGKCRDCKTAISPVYPAIELVSSGMAMWLFYRNGKTLDFVSEYTLALLLLSAACIDAKHMIIPDRLNAAGAVAGVVFAIVSGSRGLVAGLIGAVAGISVLMLLFWMGKLFYHRDGVGMGDVKLAAVIGLFLGPVWCIIALVIAIFAGGIWGIILKLGKKDLLAGQIPFGPFISLGGGAVLFFREEILYGIEYYLSLL